MATAPRRRLPGQVSITLSDAAVSEAPASKPALETDTEGTMPQSTKEVNPALLLRLWNEYALRQKEKGRSSLHATLVGREPAVIGPGRIGFSIVNEVQENYMRAEKPELLGFLRRELGDPGLELEVVKEEAKVQPRYSKLDRFKLMAGTNPALLTLQREIELDLG